MIADLKRLVEIESVSADPSRFDQVQRSADEVARLITEVGCDDVRVVAAGGKPAVIARFPAPAGKPTVCLYAHHDVQPEGVADNWVSPPFEPTERDGRLFGRGAGDDKGGIAVHLAALRAFDGRPPVGVTLFIEGEEEIGSPSLHRLLAENRDALAADVFVIADSGNWAVGQPAFTTTLRGLAEVYVEVRTLDHAPAFRAVRRGRAGCAHRALPTAGHPARRPGQRRGRRSARRARTRSSTIRPTGWRRSPECCPGCTISATARWWSGCGPSRPSR